MDRASLPLECQAVPVSQCLRPCHTPAPHPQPHPASLVLSHHGDRISKWEGLESPHIPPPPTRVPLRPTFCGSWIHMCGGGGAPDVGGRQEGNTGPWGGSLLSSLSPCQARITSQMSPSWARGSYGTKFSLWSVSLGFLLPGNCIYVRGGGDMPGCQPAGPHAN